jgi:hypothetical protein
VLDRSVDTVAQFLSRHTKRDLDAQEQQRAIELLEMQRQSMLMQTSCGWFFDDISNPGSIQVMRHAARGMELARRTLGIDLEPTFVEILRAAPSNALEYETGADVYAAQVRPAAMDIVRIGAEIALYTLIGAVSPAESSGCYEAEFGSPHRRDMGDWRALGGKVRVRSRVTGEEAVIDAIALFAGVDRIVCGVREHAGEEAFTEVWQMVLTAVTADGIDPLETVSGAFTRTYTVSDLREEERNTIAVRTLDGMIPHLSSALTTLYSDVHPALRMLDDLSAAHPGITTYLEEYACNTRLIAMIEGGVDPEQFGECAGAMEERHLKPDLRSLQEAASRRILALIRVVASDPDEKSPLDEIVDIFRSIKVFGLSLSLWESQNVCFGLLRRYTAMKTRAESGDENANAWVEAFRRAAACLRVRVA